MKKVVDSVNRTVQDHITACLQVGMATEARAFEDALVHFFNSLTEYGYIHGYENIYNRRPLLNRN